MPDRCRPACGSWSSGGHAAIVESGAGHGVGFDDPHHQATGAAAPRIVTRDIVRAIKRGAVIVDVSIDQGGCIGTSRPTGHDDATLPCVPAVQAIVQ